MVDSKEKKDCCGCGACEKSCPEQAIKMIEDDKGFYYPLVDYEKCSYCGICDDICAFKDAYNGYGLCPDVYAVKHIDRDVRVTSTSGGAFTAISDSILGNNGVVYGAGYNDRLVVCHKRAVSKKQRDELKGSKYVQSSIIACFEEVKKDLQEGIDVLFTGTPCQVAAIKSFLRKDYDKLFTVDIVCHGTPSNKLWQDYLHLMEKKANSLVSYFKFRRTDNWNNSFVSKLYFEKNNSVRNFSGQQSFIELYLKWCMLMPACYNCKYTNFNRVGDITLGDFWGIEKVIPVFADNEGVSLLLVNSEKGNQLFESIKYDLQYKNSSKNACLQEQLEKPAQSHYPIEQFWRDYDKRGMKYVLIKYTYYNFFTTFIKRVIRKFRNIVYGR